MTEHASLLCCGCQAELSPRDDRWYVVQIRAFANPAVPELELLDGADLAEEIRKIYEASEEQSERELADQVMRMMTIHLCHRCYGAWIEDPAGGLSG